MTFYNRFNSYDYLEKIQKYAALPYSPTPQLNYFTFDNTTGVMYVNVDNTKPGYISDIFNNLTAGDVIEVAADVRNLSGEKVKVAFEEYTADGNTSIPIHTYSTQKQGEWEKLNFKYIFRDVYGAKKARVVVGVFTVDIGEFEIRNIRINIKTKRNYVSLNTLFEIKPFELRKNAGTWELRTDFANGGGTVSIVDSYTLRITFTTQFINRPVAVVSNDFTFSSADYQIRVGNLNKGYADVKIYDNTGTAVQLANVADSTHFGIMFIG